jgi:hypothetical protein
MFPRKPFHVISLEVELWVEEGQGVVARRKKNMKFMKNCGKRVKAIKDKIPLPFNSHESRLYFPTVGFCRESGTRILSLPLHCSCRL